jgi:bleomycin hydrolase
MFPLIYQLVTVCLGTPPKQFTLHYKNSSKEVCSIGPVTPLEFYENHVKHVFDIEAKICLIHDPRPTSVYFDTYTVDYLNNMVSGKPVHYLNVPLDKIKAAVLASLKSGEPVWFGSDIRRAHDRQLGLATLKLVDHKLVFGFEHNSAMTKAERLEFHDSFMTHAMVIVGAHEEAQDSKDKEGDVNQPICRWRVENSWGSDYGSSGYLSMWDDWFDEFVYQVVIDRKYVSEDLLQAWSKEPHILPAWDPFGTLARY